MSMLNGNFAVVTGGTRGIGKAITESLVKQGATVGVTATNEENLKNFVNNHPNKDRLVNLGAFNLKDHDSYAKLVESAISSLGKVDILVNNAGITKDTLSIRMNKEQWDDVIDVNMNSVFWLTKGLGRHMLSNKYGRIINITSIIGITGNAGQVNYAASKGAVNAMTKSFAKEFATKGVTVNSICPGFIETDMTSSLSANEKILATIPLGRMGSPEEVADATMWLSRKESSYITGQCISVNGGMYM